MSELRHFERWTVDGALFYDLITEGYMFMAVIGSDGRFDVTQPGDDAKAPILSHEQTQELFGMYADWQRLKIHAS